LPDERRDIRCQRTAALWSDSDNLVTITKYFTSGGNIGRISSIRRPDGTMSFYTYTSGNGGIETDTIASGQPDSNGTIIIDGTLTTIVKGPLGEIISKTVASISPDSTANGKTLASENYGFSGQDDINFSRPLSLTFLDNTHINATYNCCGMDTLTDRDGATTSIGYDDLKRPTTSTRF